MKFKVAEKKTNLKLKNNDQDSAGNEDDFDDWLNDDKKIYQA